MLFPLKRRIYWPAFDKYYVNTTLILILQSPFQYHLHVKVLLLFQNCYHLFQHRYNAIPSIIRTPINMMSYPFVEMTPT
jgi:hypothetical protein